MRSLADDLRRRTDEELSGLLASRPDLLHPVPPDISALASRAGSATSVARALDSLDLFTLQVAETLAALTEPASAEQVLECFEDDLAEPVREALTRLTALALAWGDDPYRLVRTARDALGPYPGGLGPRCAEQRPRLAMLTAQKLAALLEEAPAKVRELLDTVTWGPPLGQVERADRPVSVDSAKGPLEWLLARDLLVPRGPTTVVLPAEVGLALRTLATGRPCVIADPAWPALRAEPTTHRDPALVDRAGGHSADAAVTRMADLLESWSVEAPSVLRKGGLAVRDLSLAAQHHDIDESTAAFWIELAYASGLLARDGELDEAWRPTPAFDSWSEDGLGRRWAHLAETWWRMTRAPQLVRGAVAVADPPHALSDGADMALLPALRAEIVGILAECGPGGVMTAPQVSQILQQRHPRRAVTHLDVHVSAILDQCELLGITGFGALSCLGLALQRGAETEVLVDMIEKVSPRPVDHVMIQGDLTAVAPGPLTAPVARRMRLLADVESTGGATVYRFSESSLRRAFDGGSDAEAILAELVELSTTDLPQALIYLVRDLGRRHGHLRVGAAGAYVRCEDSATATAVLNDPRSRALALRELAPGILVTTASPDRVLRVLREIGHSPVPETSDGTALIVGPRPRRTPPRTPPVPTAGSVTPRRALVAAAVASLRAAGSPEPAADTGTGPAGTARETLRVVRAALESGAPIRLGYLDSTGAIRSSLVAPVRLAAGLLTATDQATGQLRSYTVARITGAEPA